MAGEASKSTIVSLPLYQPPPTNLPNHLTKCRAGARHSAWIFYIFPYNCCSKILASAESNAVRAHFRLAKKPPLCPTPLASPEALFCPGQVRYARSIQGLRIWQYLFFNLATSHCHSNSFPSVTATLSLKRQLPPQSLHPPAKRCCLPDQIAAALSSPSSLLPDSVVDCIGGPEYHATYLHDCTQ